LLQEVAIISSEYRENNLKKKKQASKEKQISDLGKKAREKYSSVFTERNEILCIESEDAIETLTYGSEEIVPYNDHTYGNIFVFTYYEKIKKYVLKLAMYQDDQFKHIFLICFLLVDVFL